MSDQPFEDFTDTIGPVAEKHRRRALGQIADLHHRLDEFEAAVRTTDGVRWDAAAQSLGVGIIALSIMIGLVRGSAGTAGET